MAGAAKKRVRRARESHAESSGHGSEHHASHTSSHEHSNPSSPLHESSSSRMSSSHSHSASHSGSAPASRQGSMHTTTGGEAYRSPPRWDGNRDPETMIVAPCANVKNIDLGMGNWSAIRGAKMDIPKRPKPSTLGREIAIGLNTFNVTQLPNKKPVYQYDVLAGNGAEKRGLVMKLWSSKAVQKALGAQAKGWIFDGNKIAWSMDLIDRELRIAVDLDDEQGRQPGKKPNQHRIIIKQSTTVKFDVLEAYLAGQCEWDNKCLEAITFADHLLRETPSKKYTAIKRMFFAPGEQRFSLSPGVEAFKGVYQSIRIAHQPSGKHCLTVNVDVANGTFWSAQLLSRIAVTLSRARDEASFANACKKIKAGDGSMKDSQGFLELKRLRKLHVIAGHRGEEDSYVVDRIINQNAKEHIFKTLDKATGQESSISVYDYFGKKYGVRLSHPEWPLVQMTKKSVLPLEVLKLKENQRYQYKLDDRQTSNMIKFAVTPPAERWKAVEHGLGMLKWPEDPYLKNYGMTIVPKKVVVKARLLTAPEVQFSNGSAKPGTSGRWDLKGKKFLTPNKVPLKSWGVCVISGRGMQADKATIDRFIAEFVKTYTMHGGQVVNKTPVIHLGSPDPGKAVEEIWNKAGNASQARPQILVFILPDKDSLAYGRIKKSCECRYGVVSQCMQYAHVQKCQGQYISNVLMKFNAKLGGVTARAVGAQTKGPGGIFGTSKTVVIGCDVSHAAPGAQTASMAAMTMSTDKLATRYAAACNTNGYRVEMVTTENITKLLKPLFQGWISTVGGGAFPDRIFYVRDGVSEGQFQYVIHQEVADIKALLKTANPNCNPKFVVITCTKRHHIRMFPEGGGDRNGNPLPGTLVETGVTHPRENDFFLNSHAAIKGTSRPTKYHVLLNEANCSNEELQTMLYEHSYQYIRATTPVSLYPAVYYAHLAAARAIHHDPAFGGGSAPAPTKGGQSETGSGKPQTKGTGSSAETPTFAVPLMEMPNPAEINSAMWYM